MAPTMLRRRAAGASALLLLVVTSGAGRALAGPLPDEDPFPRQVEISFRMAENTAEMNRTDDVRFTATKREACIAGGQCGYEIDQESATVSLEYDDIRFGCRGTAGAPPFNWMRGRVGFDMQDDDGSHGFSFTIELDYSTTHYRCDDNTSGTDGGSSSSGSTDADVPWTPGLQESTAVPVSNFNGGAGHADIRYRY